MKVVSPSYEILKDLDEQSLASRIEVCGRLCYKSEDKITPESAPPFIRRILKHGHNSVAEMAVLTLKIDLDSDAMSAQLFAAQPKYFQLDRIDKKTLLMSGSVRAFRELFLEHHTIKIVKAITTYLADRHPLFFEDILPKRALVIQQGVNVEKIPLSEVEKMPADLFAKHRYIAVKFIVNRAVTHEMVRHRPCGFLQESQRYCRYSDSKFGSQVTFIKPLFYQEGTEEYRIWEQAMAETEKLYVSLLETSTAQAARTVLPNSCKTELIVYANLLQWYHMFRLRTSKGADPSMREVMIPLLDDFKKEFPGIFDTLSVES
ncbi:MAG: FAD-dependent thymidylate synthase [Desulfobulbaceae bacterium]|uniref:FAD-dependent thymidylate synthase n=1 Tax=Candidatus Desulfobia pelagia TaxID=2841692 RepID=A0A8J6NC40_9BACT|nr:FAD-dependent thymidylate synthase [Candidatus Desulfobia pelagia]